MVRMNVGSQVSSQAPDGTREGLRLKGRPELVTDKNQVREEAGNPTHGPTVGRQSQGFSLFLCVLWHWDITLPYWTLLPHHAAVF